MQTKTRRACGGCWAGPLALVLAAGQAIGRNDNPLEAGSELELAEVVPGDLPGHEPGPRTRPEAPEAEPAAAESEPEDLPEWFGGKPLWEWSRLTGNWGGVRDGIEDWGLTIGGSYTMDWTNVVSGGRRQKSSYRHLFDVNATFDLEKLVGLNGGQVFVDFYSAAGDGASEDAGDIQGLSNIETGHVDQIAELWYEQWLFDQFLRVKVGKVDANTEFAFANAAGEVINSSAGFSPTIFPLPSYPDPAMSVNAFVYPCEWFYAGAGLYDGATQDGYATGGRGPSTFFSDDKSSDWFLIAEAGLTAEKLGFLTDARLAIGGWHHSGSFDTFDADTDDGTSGFYCVGECRLWSPEPDNAESERGLFAFAQYGWADPEVSEVHNHVGFGLTLVGVCDCRPDDAIAAYISWADLSDETGAGFDEDETVVELAYAFQVTPAFVLRPDIQFIFNPSGDASRDTAIVLSLRASVEF